MQIVNMNRIADDVVAKFVCFADCDPGLESAARHPIVKSISCDGLDHTASDLDFPEALVSDQIHRSRLRAFHQASRGFSDL
jgi:hypothetical protein